MKKHKILTLITFIIIFGTPLLIGHVKSKPSIKIALLDSGINISLFSKSSLRFVDKNFVQNESLSNYGDHGTAMLSVINKNISTTKDVDIYNAKVLNSSGQGKIEATVVGLKWAISQNVNIINMSYGFSRNYPKLEKLVNDAKQKGIIIVAAGGNNLFNDSDYPARYEDTISVGASTKDGKIASFNSKDSQDVYALGVHVKVTNSDGKRILANGSSISTARITGLLATHDMNMKNSKLYTSKSSNLSYLRSLKQIDIR